jgi:PAS domain S-box-containing protein
MANHDQASEPDHSAAEQSLRISEERCRLLVSTSLDGVLLTAPEGRILAANPAACEMFGRTEEDICRLGRVGVVDVTDPRLALAVAERDRTGRFRGELTFLRSDGTRFPGEVSSAVFTDGHGDLRTSMVVRDVSAHRAAEDRVRASERFLRDTLDALSAHIAILDQAGTIVGVNRAWREFALANDARMGAVAEGANYLQVCESAATRGEAGVAEIAAALEDILAGRRTGCIFEYPCHSPGEQRWFVMHATRFADPGPRVVVAHEDITPRRRAEIEVRASEERFRAIADYTADWENWIDPDGRLVWVNPSVERVTGYNVAECVAMAGFPMALVAPDDRATAAAAWGPVCRDSAGTGLEFRFIRRDGTRRWASVSWQPLYSADGTWMGHRSSARDVTDSHVAREQARALAARLQQVREEERTRIAREIHDVLAQDLTRLKIDLIWLLGRLGRPVPPETAGLLAERVSGMSALADSTIRSVQRIATELRPVVLDSLGFCAAVEWQGIDLEARTAIRCRVQVPAEEPRISREVATEAFRIVQEALTNVVRHADASRVDITVEESASRMCLTIHDNGRGIPPEMLADPRSIGLAGMRERAMLVGGELLIAGHADGTTISVQLPLRADAEHESP